MQSPLKLSTIIAEDIFKIMANGIEDLEEKNKDKQKLSVKKYSEWANFQGREDAEMLLEKKSSWSAARANRGDYDDWD